MTQNVTSPAQTRFPLVTKGECWESLREWLYPCYSHKLGAQVDTPFLEPQSQAAEFSEQQPMETWKKRNTLHLKTYSSKLQKLPCLLFLPCAASCHSVDGKASKGWGKLRIQMLSRCLYRNFTARATKSSRLHWHFQTKHTSTLYSPCVCFLKERLKATWNTTKPMTLTKFLLKTLSLDINWDCFFSWRRTWLLLLLENKQTNKPLTIW